MSTPVDHELLRLCLSKGVPASVAAQRLMPSSQGLHLLNLIEDLRGDLRGFTELGGSHGYGELFWGKGSVLFGAWFHHMACRNDLSWWEQEGLPLLRSLFPAGNLRNSRWGWDPSALVLIFAPPTPYVAPVAALPLVELAEARLVQYLSPYVAETTLRSFARDYRPHLPSVTTKHLTPFIELVGDSVVAEITRANPEILPLLRDVLNTSTAVDALL